MRQRQFVFLILSPLWLVEINIIFFFRQLVRLGEHDLSSANDGANPMDFPIIERIVHEDYVPNLILNDIAILKLRDTLRITGKLKLVYLALICT